MLAAKTMNNLLMKNSTLLTVDQRLEIRNYVLKYLGTNLKLASFVMQSLIDLITKITKLGWFDVIDEKYVFREIPEISLFVQGDVDYCNIGVSIIASLVMDMNSASYSGTGLDMNRYIFKHRKIATSFRDKALYEYFILTRDLLKRILERLRETKFLNDHEQTLVNNLLKLSVNCLSFDFIGTILDESNDDSACVQIPTTWRPVFIEDNILKLYFDLFHLLPSHLASLTLSCLVQLASIRRTIFQNAERLSFIENLFIGIRSILESPQGLSDQTCFHEFCRLLSRLKVNFQLSELIKVSDYQVTLALIAKFTIQSFQMISAAGNSVFYLLFLWQKMIASMPYVKGPEPHCLERYAPDITSAYIRSRIDICQEVLYNDVDDPFEEITVIEQQLELLASISRCDYEKTCSLIVSIFDVDAPKYQELLNSMNINKQLTIIEEMRLTWLLYIISSAISGKMFLTTPEKEEQMDAELAVRVLQLMNFTDSRLTENRGFSQRIELGYLNFFEKFKKSYMHEQMSVNSVVFKQLGEVLGIVDEGQLLSVFVRKL